MKDLSPIPTAIKNQRVVGRGFLLRSTNGRRAPLARNVAVPPLDWSEKIARVFFFLTILLAIYGAWVTR